MNTFTDFLRLFLSKTFSTIVHSFIFKLPYLLYKCYALQRSIYPDKGSLNNYEIPDLNHLFALTKYKAYAHTPQHVYNSQPTYSHYLVRKHVHLYKGLQIRIGEW